MGFDGQKVENTLYVQNESAWDATSLEELATEVAAWWNSSYSNLCSTSVQLTEVVCTDLTAETGGQVSVAGGGALGVVTGGKLPGNCSLAVSFRTALRGRSYRGRNYIVGIPETYMFDTSKVADDYVAAVLDAYEGFLTAIGTAGWTWVVLSRYEGVDPDTHRPIPREAGVMTPVLNVVVVDKTIDSQRRRLPGRGA
jgi:hypothetical protein